MTKKMLYCLWIICTLLVSQSYLKAQDVQQIIDQHLEAMGGKEQLATLKSLKVSSVVSVMGVEMQLTTLVVHQQSLRSETDIQGMKIIQVLDKGAGWQINPLLGSHKASSLSQEELQALSNQLDLTGLLNYQEKGYQVRLVGEDQVLNTPVYKLELLSPFGIKSTNYISKQTNLVIQTTIDLVVQGVATQTSIVLSNYQRVNGIMFPFTSTIQSSQMPQQKMVSTTKKLEVNPDFSPSLFKKP